VLRTLAGHKGWVSSVVVTPDGLRAISASNDKMLKVWGLSSGQCLTTFDTNEQLNACAVAPDGITIIAGGESGRVHFLRFVEK
jgi:WD40 repeat protein